MVSTGSETFTKESPGGTTQTYRDIWGDNEKRVGGAIAAAAVPLTYEATLANGQKAIKEDFRRENTIVYDPARINNESFGHEFFHIAYDKGDVDLAKELGLDPSKFKGPTEQARASQAIDDFIKNKCGGKK
jgi:hypothetical protein